jgi:hypothetical protein
LSVVNFARTEERFHGVVPRDNEPSDIGQDLTTEVEEDEEEVQADETEEGINLWHGGLSLEVVKDLVRGFSLNAYSPHL